MRKITVDFLDDRSQTITLTWNRKDAKDVEIARRKFTEYSEKGWIAFTVTDDGKKNHIYRFDPKFKKIVLMRLLEGG